MTTTSIITGNLEERTLRFASNIRAFARQLPKETQTDEDVLQLIRSSSAVGGNLIEANEDLKKSAYTAHIRLCLKEAKESCFWLRLLHVPEPLAATRDDLLRESRDLLRIFFGILKRVRRQGMKNQH